MVPRSDARTSETHNVRRSLSSFIHWHGSRKPKRVPLVSKIEGPLMSKKETDRAHVGEKVKMP
jgi:hypothetical protein